MKGSKKILNIFLGDPILFIKLATSTRLGVARNQEWNSNGQKVPLKFFKEATKFAKISFLKDNFS